MFLRGKSWSERRKVATFALSKENNPAGFDKKIRFLVQNRFKVNRLFLYRFLVFGY